MEEPGRSITTVGVLLVAFGLLCLRRRKPLQILGHTVISFRLMALALGSGAVLIAAGLMVGYPERR